MPKSAGACEGEGAAPLLPLVSVYTTIENQFLYGKIIYHGPFSIAIAAMLN
jgi:hypothetical protein